MHRVHVSHRLRVWFVIFGILCLSGLYVSLAEPINKPVYVHILAVNDLHGQLGSGQKLNGSAVGSVPVLGGYLLDAIARYGNNSTLIALPGDMTGASPAESNLLLDEPTILFLNSLVTGDWKKSALTDHDGVRVIATLGNHEFDRNASELERLIHGGNGDTQIPHLVDPYPGALWPIIAANVYWKENDTLFCEPYVIEEIGGIPIAFIGAVTATTAEISKPEHVAPFKFTDEADAINYQVKKLQEQGIHAFVVLLHEGGEQTPYEGSTKETGDLSGRIVSLTLRLDEDVDVVLSGHTHAFTNQFIPNAGGKPTLVTQAYSYSAAYADLLLTIDPTSHEIIAKNATIITTDTDHGPGLIHDKNAQELLDAVNTTIAPLISEVIGVTSVPLTRTLDEHGESSLYNVVTDAFRSQMDTDMSILNIGYLRADIDAGNITTGDVYSVMPFHDQVYAVRMTGQQIKDLLNQQWTRTVKPDHLLQISGFSYSYDASREPSDRVINITFNGKELDMTAQYTVATTDFLTFGGDGYTAMQNGTVITYGDLDANIFIDYLKSLRSQIAPQTGERIHEVGHRPYQE